MNKEEILEKLKLLKPKYEKEGFIIQGLFGSFSRGEDSSSSEIDLLYSVSDSYLKKHSGWDYFIKLEEIKKEFSEAFARKVDIADKDSLNENGKKYILKDLIYV